MEEQLIYPKYSFNKGEIMSSFFKGCVFTAGLVVGVGVLLSARVEVTAALVSRAICYTGVFFLAEHVAPKNDWNWKVLTSVIGYDEMSDDRGPCGIVSKGIGWFAGMVAEQYDKMS
jgi:hypothetical protein